jgi:hypothetical protein
MGFPVPFPNWSRRRLCQALGTRTGCDGPDTLHMARPSPDQAALRSKDASLEPAKWRSTRWRSTRWQSTRWQSTKGTTERCQLFCADFAVLVRPRAVSALDAKPATCSPSSAFHSQADDWQLEWRLPCGGPCGRSPVGWALEDTLPAGWACRVETLAKAKSTHFVCRDAGAF